MSFLKKFADKLEEGIQRTEDQIDGERTRCALRVVLTSVLQVSSIRTVRLIAVNHQMIEIAQG
jgi:hypothetical protein